MISSQVKLKFLSFFSGLKNLSFLKGNFKFLSFFKTIFELFWHFLKTKLEFFSRKFQKNAAGLFTTKLRSNLGDDMIDNLRSYLIKK